MYDYLIVGAGSAGCVLANRLSADPAIRVCLLEAGPPDTHPLIRVPMGIVYMMMSKKLNWRYFTEAEPQLDGRRLFWPRGKTLGGSSASNAMIYTRGHRADYDHWAALGNPGWAYDDVLPYFKLAEHREAGADAWHGAGGPLNVARLRTPNRLSAAFIEAACQAGYRRNDDFNGAEQEGVGYFEVTQKGGERCSAARAYLEPVRARSNLTVLTGAQVTRVRLEGRRAVGVTLRQGGRTFDLDARAEVIVAAGAINSPQLLMLSGIGPPAELARHGIALAHALPGVGENLQDHLDVLLLHRCRHAASLGLSWRTAPAYLGHLLRYLRQRSGPLTTNSTEAGGFIRSGPEQRLPDLQFHFTPARLEGHARDLRRAARTLLGHGYALHVCQLRPRSRGRIGLHSADPLAPARIEAAYLSDPYDLQQMVAAVKAARAVLDAPAFAHWRGAALYPAWGAHDDAAIAQWVRAHAESIYHPVGSCRMGADAGAVVDASLAVHGMRGLRVIDASIMPTLVGGNTNAPTIMIAERGAQLILQARQAAAPALHEAAGPV